MTSDLARALAPTGTERKLILRHGSTLFTTIVDHMPGGIVADGRLIPYADISVVQGRPL